MANTSWTSDQLEGFRAAAESLKLYRRAELEDPIHQKSLIKDLYVDPLPEEHVFKTVLRSNTTFLIGRKLTGKSTIFQRVQYELRQMKGYGSAYIDIKTVYEAAVTDPLLINQLGADALGPEAIQKLRLYRAFIKAVISAIKDEIKKRAQESTWARVKDSFTGSSEDLFESLDDLLEAADETEFVTVLGIRREESQQNASVSRSDESNVAGEAKLSHVPSATLAHRPEDFWKRNLGRTQSTVTS